MNRLGLWGRVPSNFGYLDSSMPAACCYFLIMFIGLRRINRSVKSQQHGASANRAVNIDESLSEISRSRALFWASA